MLKQKIAFFHNLPVGGAKKVLYYQIKLLSKNNDIDVYEYDSTDQTNLSVHNLPCKRVIYHDPVINDQKRLCRDFNMFINLQLMNKNIAKEIDSKNYDFVIIHPDRYTQAPFILRFLKSPNFYYCHELLRIAYEDMFALNEAVPLYKKWYENSTRKIKKYIDKKNAQSARFIICNSEFTKKNIKNAYRREAFVCYPGVDTSIFHSDSATRKTDILFIGEKIFPDGYDLLEASLKYFTHIPSVKIISRKSGNYSISERDLMNVYNQSKTVVCLSRDEPFGLIPLEAMACGIPVVALNEGGYKETIQNNVTGFLVPEDSKIIAKTLEELLINTHIRQTFGENAKTAIEKQWNWEKSVQKLLFEAKSLLNR